MSGFFGKTPEDFSPAKRILLASGFVLFLLLLSAFFYWLYAWEARYIAGLINNDRALVVFRRYMNAAFFAPLVGLSLAGLLFQEVFYRDLLRKPVTRIGIFTRKILVTSVITGFLLMLVGGFALNLQSESRFEQAGYHECSTILVRYTKSFTHSVWVKDPNDCHDKTVDRILTKHHDRQAFDDAARHLEKKNR